METKECSLHRLVADVCVLAEHQILLVRYKDTNKYDGQAGWFLPDNYLAYLEHPETAAQRILQEQVGLDETELTLSHIESFGNGWWHLVFHYRVKLPKPLPLRLGENIAAADWFDLDALPDLSE